MQSKAQRQTRAMASEARCETIGGVLCRVLDPDGPRTGAVLLLHGLGGSREFLLPHYANLAGGGIAVVAPDAPFHGTRFGAEAKRLMAAGITAFLYRAVLGWLDEARALLGELGSEPVGVVGFSMGAFVAHRLAASSLPVRAAVAHSGCGCWLEREQRRATRMPAELVSRVTEHDPRTRRPECPPTPLLLTHGGRDTVVDPALAQLDLTELRAAYSAFPDRLDALRVDDMAHEMTIRTAEAGRAWLHRWLPVRQAPDAME